MKWNVDKSRPICPQICEQICVLIANKELMPKSKLFSVRELALELGVNPNTVQKSFETLETQGVIYSVRGSGWYVSENIDSASKVVKSLLDTKTDMYILEMQNLGYSIEDVIKYLSERVGS